MTAQTKTEKNISLLGLDPYHSTPEAPPPNSPPPIGGAEDFGEVMCQFGYVICQSQPSLSPKIPLAVKLVMASRDRVFLLSVGQVSLMPPEATAFSSSMHFARGGAPALPVTPSLNNGRNASMTNF